MNRLNRFNFFTLLATLFIALPAWPHGGEDHSHDAPPPAPVDVAPRAAAQTEEFELLAVLAGGKLTLWLDRYADNAPVEGARIEVESGTFKAKAEEIAPAVYALPADALTKPGQYSLTVSIETAESADILVATLDSTPSGKPAEAAATHVHSRDEWIVWGASAGVLLAGVALIWLRRRRKG